MSSLALQNVRKLRGQKLCHIGGTAFCRQHFHVPTSGDPIIIEMMRLLKRDHAGNIMTICRKAGVYNGIFGHIRKGRNVSLSTITALLNAAGYELRIVRQQQDDPDDTLDNSLSDSPALERHSPPPTISPGPTQD
mgnify:FL=1